ncbi:MAG: membrane protein insertase YidC, partial [Gallionella sp.]|nr:membrane protein insertase YidC [Gallionella sp.]
MMIWDGWQRYQQPQVVQQANTVKSDLPVATIKAADVAAQATILQASEKQVAGKIIKVKTDILEAEISSVGGDIQHLNFLNHPDGEDKNKHFVLFEKGANTHSYVAQSGLLGEGMPNHNSIFTVEQDRYELAANADQLQVRLTAEESNGIKVVKLLTFHKNSYVIDITYEIENSTGAVLNTSAYYQFIRDSVAPAGDSMMLPTYTGVAVYTEQEKFQKVVFSDIDKAKVDYPKESDNGWIGML